MNSRILNFDRLDDMRLLDHGRRANAPGPSASSMESPLELLENPNSNSSREIRLKPRESLDVEINVGSVANFGLTFIASSAVSVSLVDKNGSVVAKSSAEPAIAGILFRNLFVNKQVSGGIWKLRLQNTLDNEHVFVGYGWSAEAVTQ